MRKFREFISEEIMPFAQTEKGFVGIDNGPVRDNINLLLANVTTMPYSTPYHAMEAIRRVLISFHIALPATNFLSGESGHEVFPINQFGKKLGALPTGDVVTQMPSAYYVYFEYEMTDSGSFDIFCEVIDEEELSTIMSDIEDEESDAMDHDAEDSYDAYKAANMSEQIVYRGENKDSAKRRKIMSVLHTKKTNKLLPGMHEDYDSNEAEMANRAKEFFNSPSKVIQSNARKIHKSHNDKAVTGMKEEEKLNEVSKDLLNRYIKKAKKQDRKAGVTLATKKKYGSDKTNDPKVKATNEENINEISKQLAHKASEKAYEKGSEYYDSTTKLRGKAFKSKDKGDMEKATAEQGKMSKKWKQSMKFKAYADKKLKEETELDRWKRKYDERKKEMGHDYVNVLDKPPFDNPTEKPSTPYKNKAAKSKQLARAAMKAAMKKAKSEKK